MKYILLFQHSCRACSEVARMVRASSVPGLDASPIQDPRILELLSDAGREVPDRPSLLIIGDDDIEVISGWAMRRRLAGLVGWRRAGTISRLAVAEGRARLGKLAGPSVPARRKVIGGGLAAGLAGGLAWVLKSPGSAAAAGGSRSVLASPAEKEQLLATKPAQRAISTWGPATRVYKVSGGTKEFFLLAHDRTQVITLVDASLAALRSGRVGALSMGRTPGGTVGVRTYLVNGTALTDTAPDGTVTMAYTPGDDPDVTPLQIWQFIGCCMRPASAQCVINCITCVFQKSAVACAECTVCAGPNAADCVLDIFGE